jgi:molybdopterin-binding protein
MNHLRPKQAAAAIGVSYPTLKQWIYQGQIQAVKTPGGHYRIPLSEIERLTRGPMEKRERVLISGRNRLRGTVAAIRQENLLAAVTIAIGDQQVQAIITADAVRELGLAVGMPATALIKATEVMVMREFDLPGTAGQPTAEVMREPA